MEMLVTLREFAEKYGIKKPTVNARLKRLEKSHENEILSVKNNNLIYLTDLGLTMLEKSFNEHPVKAPVKKAEKPPNPVKDNNQDKLIESYQEQITQLQADLDTERRRTERLLKLIDELIDQNVKLSGSVGNALRDSQRLISQEQSLALMDKAPKKEPRKKKSWLSRLTVAGRVLKGDFD